MVQSEAYIQTWWACRDACARRMQARAKVYRLRAREDKAFMKWAFTSSMLGSQQQFNHLRKVSALLCDAVAEEAAAEVAFKAAQDLRTAVAVRGWRGERV